jgi:hypothetical protein
MKVIFFIVVMALTFVGTASAQPKPNWIATAILMNEIGVVVEVRLADAGDTDTCADTIKRFGAKANSRNGLVWSASDYSAGGDQQPGVDIKNFLVGLSCQLRPRPKGF